MKCLEACGGQQAEMHQPCQIHACLRSAYGAVSSKAISIRAGRALGWPSSARSSAKACSSTDLYQ